MMAAFVGPILTVVFIWFWAMVAVIAYLVLLALAVVPAVLAPVQWLGEVPDEVLLTSLLGLAVLSSVALCTWCWPRRLDSRR
jgi:hypothetical protein